VTLPLQLQATLLAGLSLVVLSIAVYAVRTGVPPMPTSPRGRNRILSLIPPDCTGNILDLGCGWGTLVFPIAGRHPQNRVIGYELSPLPWFLCRIRKWITPRENLRIIRGDFWKSPCSDAAVVVCYLDPSQMPRLEKKLSSELRPGTLVIVNGFAFPSWKPECIHQLSDFYCSRVYVYRVSTWKAEP
jgi:trans-aconitate methyltransferase